ncbi:MAG: hypothetical protein NTZ48_02090, partial [Candidatus Omnitrophica bacterium]|nr:hypothetical protein [Candidatus Omnitrophota bacterium]
ETVKEYADLVAAYIVREKTGIIPTNVPADIASIIESIFNTEEKASLDDVLWFILISEYTKTPFRNFPKINSLPDGYRLIKDIDEFKNTFNCFGYALNKDEGVTVKEFKTILENDFTETGIPQNGDLVVYINRDIGIVHAGIYSNGKVISKFNHGPVLEHPIDENIPDIWAWGEYKFYRRR